VSTAIAAAEIESSHNLGITVVTEGVETGEPHGRLGALDRDLIQGYIRSPPGRSGR
jgi:EAL domain-containing protein (putative c-di-GMP-specific phosphodiesterase class I)